MQLAKKKRGARASSSLATASCREPFPSFTERCSRICTGLVGRMPTRTGWKPLISSASFRLSGGRWRSPLQTAWIQLQEPPSIPPVSPSHEARVRRGDHAGPRFSARMSLKSRSGTRTRGAKRRAKRSCIAAAVPGDFGTSGTNRPSGCPSSLSSTIVSPSCNQASRGAKPSATSWMEAVFMGRKRYHLRRPSASSFWQAPPPAAPCAHAPAAPTKFRLGKLRAFEFFLAAFKVRSPHHKTP